ncbi:LysR family transcriptional regulator [Bacillus altitudinis]|uniref:LysR family transcriptional regulator n=1 Tax=Bacillus altitudinis TaxID=293387 RepID=UPI0002E64239|nr:LysR family transcriptional regulator [Bacillus altitudinis]QKL21205.1 LysR family transcriptional regulator [Bacillus altitudinis]QKL24935.1 LysR family transcriptional regulator [Bacillus altitudinis]QXY95322.1 LysR family transcriptional regulator [Bacillus altitudinis]
MNIENIEAFIYVCQLGSINKAAEALYLTQPSVSARIQSLEKELDLKLFDRQRNKLSLTEKGEQFYPHAKKILHSYQEAKHSLKQTMIPYELTIGCASSISNNLLPNILPALKEKYENLKVKIVTGHSKDVVQKVINNQVDFGIVRTETHPQIESIPIFSDPIGLFVPTHHPLASYDNINMNELEEQPFIFFDYGSFDWLMLHRLFQKNNITPNISIEVDHMETAKNLVLQGMGLSFLPHHCVRNEVEQGTLKQISIDPSIHFNINIEFIYKKGKSKSVFIDQLKQFFHELD